MKVAALDLGSNTFLMLIADVTEGRLTKIYRDEIEVVRLGQGLAHTGRISNEALKRAKNCFHRFSEIIKVEKPERVVAVATSAARDASNRAEFENLARSYNINVQTITGEKEAAVTFKGATFDLKDAVDPLVIDVGGGSTEIINQHSGISLNIGSVRLTDRFFAQQPPNPTEMLKLKDFLKSELAKAPLPKNSKTIVGVAGTPVAFACLQRAMPYDETFIHKSVLTLKQIETWVQKLFPLPIVAREQLAGMPPNRSDVLVAGGAILSATLQALESSELVVSTKGVRYGLALLWESF